MRKLLAVVISLLCIVCANALNIECVGTATQVVNDKDTLFIFFSKPHLKSKVGATTWYRISDNSEYAKGVTDIYPDGDGLGLYILVGERKEEFYIFDYSLYKPTITDVQVTPSCTSTTLSLKGEIPQMTYMSSSGQQRTYVRTVSLAYTDLAWDGEAWQDSAVTMDDIALRTADISLPTFYAPTVFTLTYEPLMEQLGLTPATISTADMVQPIAVKSNLTTQTTVRGTPEERSNELERPTDASVLSGSAPLDILFKANPTPAVEFYQWRIYKGVELITQRREAEQRYTFTEPGSYRVVCWVSNSLCPCTDSSDPTCQPDSSDVVIKVSESRLRVPNVFTPNGDGVNDEFRVEYRSLKEFHCWVYNRWGKLVYEWTDPAKGWDGNINGRPAAEGAYFYVIRAMGTDAGMDDYTSKINYGKLKNKSDESIIGVYQLSGDINLLRGKK